MKRHNNNRQALLRSTILAVAILFTYAGAQAQVQVGGNVFGGGNLANVGGNTSVLLDQANAVVTGDVYGGGALANVGTNNGNTTTVTLLQGTVSHDVYGGGLGDETHAALVNGVVTVNVGSGTVVAGFATSTSGSATIGGSVYGCNNANGSPQDNVTVNIYSTAHNDDNRYPDPEPDADALAIQESSSAFAIKAVYGGGNKAAYAPVNDTKTTLVHIYSCDNTIETVYGGGNAANATKVAVTIDGGRFDRVFGGGNGFSLTGNHTQPYILDENDDPTSDPDPNYNPGANVTVSATTAIHGGLYRQVYGGSNQYGNVANASLTIDKTSPCNELIAEAFGGANEAELTGNISTTLACSSPSINIGNFYGGSNLADITGNVTLTVEGGTYSNVFGGSKGRAAKAAVGEPGDPGYQPAVVAKAANITGNVELNLRGGTMTNAFGGSDVNGNITGSITVNLNDAGSGTCPLVVHNIYGGGRDASYTPTTLSSYPAVNLLNGTVSTYMENAETLGGNVFGGGLGSGAVVTSNPVVTLNGATVEGAIFGGGSAAGVDGNTTVTLTSGTLATAFGGGNVAGVTGTSTMTLTGCTVSGGLYGGCNASGSVGAVTIALNGGTVGATGAGNEADVFGGGYGPATTTTDDIAITLGGTTVYGDIYGGSALGSVNASTSNTTTITINGSNLHGTIYGGGEGSNENGGTTATSNGNVLISYNTANSDLAGLYGGANIRGNVVGNIIVNVLANVGAAGDGNNRNIFGGGLGQHTTTEGDVTVTVGSEDGTKTPTVYGDIYGGSALGSVNDAEADATTVNFLGGTLHGNIFGGGLGDKASLNVDENDHSHSDIPAAVNGTVTVNISNSTQTAENCHITLTGCNIYGCNNTNGSPQGNVAVNIYKTAHTTTDTYTYREDDHTNGDPTYAIANVFGGGKQADYAPEDGLASSTKKASVTIYGCTNTIEDLFGGGDAAAAVGVATVVPGGRFGRIFGGGNGEVEAANIGAGGTNLQIHGGYIGQLFGGSNERGTISGTMSTLVDNTNECAEDITEFFGGSNLADLGTEGAPVTLETTIGCGTVFTNVYGGCNLADIHGDVTLTIEGGTITNVYAGSKGRAAEAAVLYTAADEEGGLIPDGKNVGDVKTPAVEAKAANIYGNTTLHIYGGNIGDAFGGSNINGNITGSITVDMDWSQSGVCGDTKHLGNLYGASNLATYTPTTPGDYPAVTVKHGTVTYDVFGGGKGSSAVVTSNPVVTLGDNNNEHYAVARNVYGGGDAAAVDGSTTVTYNDAHASSTVAKLFGGGNAAGVSGDANVTLTAGKVSAGLYGGCNSSGSVGDVVMALNGGAVGTNAVHANVYGGGYGHSTSTTGNIGLTLNGTTVYGDLYGGSALGAVGDDGKTTTVNISSNTLHGTIYGGGEGSGSGDATRATTNGNIQVNYNTANTSLAGLYGGANTNGNVVGNIEVNVLANVGAAAVGTQGEPGYVAENRIDIFGGGYGENTATQGNVTVTVGDVDNNNQPVVYGDVYGGSALGQVNDAEADITTVNIISGTLHGNTYGGGLGETGVGNETHGQVNGTISVNIGANTGTNESPVHVGYATIDGDIYGCNNTNGSPQGNATVNIYGTAHTTDPVNNTTAGTAYAIDEVFGGGRNAAFTTTGKTATVNVFTCDNTIRRVFGGGDAAAVPGSVVAIWGGRIDDLFGGGNGEVTAANIGAGGITITMHGGRINRVINASNQSGTIGGDINVTVDNEGGCSQVVDEFFGGSNMVDITGNVSTTIGCGAGTFGAVYGGSNKADIDGNVSLTIQGGTIGRVFGGSKGDLSTLGEGHADNSADITGDVSLTLNGGTIGAAFGGSNINGSIGGAITVNVTDLETENCGLQVDSVFGAGNVTAYTGSPVVNINHGTVGHSGVPGVVFGGGKGTTATVTGTPEVTIGDGVGGQMATITGSVFGGGDAAPVTGSTLLTINSGSVMERIVGGGNAADVSANTHVVVNGGTHGTGAGASRGIYGGCNTSGTVGGNVVVDVLGGTFGSQAIINTHVPYNIHGGGFGSSTTVTGNVTVNYGDGSTGIHSEYPKLYGDLYGGSALGSVNTNSSNTTTVNVLNGSFGLATQMIDYIENQWGANIYGGGLGDKSSLGEGHANVEATVNGKVYVNIGAPAVPPATEHTGWGNLVHCNVYGCNNVNGSPQDEVYVKVYKTYHTDGTNGTVNNLVGSEDNYFAIYSVYGGGNVAAYNPPAPGGGHSKTQGAKTHVYVYGCDNTIEYIYGGGNAASVVGTITIVEGGRFGDIYGGGNGLVVAADVGNGGAGLKLLAGHFHYQVNRCNLNGNISGPAYEDPDVTGFNTCTGGLVGDTKFFGADEAITYGNIDNTISCGGSEFRYKYVYAGSRYAVVYGDISLTVNGGTIENLFGGSKGFQHKAAHVKKFPSWEEIVADSARATENRIYPKGMHKYLYDDHSANDNCDMCGQGGNITLTIKGGDIGSIYGGCDINGTVEGTITIIIDSAATDVCPALDIDYVYGGGNKAVCEPVAGGSVTSPLVQLVNGHVNYDVFGAGRGDPDNLQNVDAGVVHSNPKVEMNPTGSNKFRVGRNIYGGGYLAQVDGSTLLEIGNGTVGGSVYGGGKGYYKDGTEEEHELARVLGNTRIDFSGGKVTYNIYGGGEIASVGTIYNYADTATTAKHTDPATSFALSWPYKFVYADGTGSTTINVTGGRVGLSGKDYMGPVNVAGKPYDPATMDYDDPNDTLTKAQVKELREDNGDIYGGCKGLAADRYTEAHFANVKETHITINYASTPAASEASDASSSVGCITGALYGGAENGHVNDSTVITFKKGLVGHALYGAGKGTGTYAAHLLSRVDDSDSLAPASTSITAGKVYGNVYINMTDGHVVRNIFGGGNRGSVGIGNYAGGPTEYYKQGYGEYSASDDDWTAARNSGHTYITITNGKVGGTGEKDGLPYGNVFGASRGEAAPEVRKNPRISYCPEFFLAYTNNTHVVIGTKGSDTGPEIWGSVYGGGQDGHVRWNTDVKVYSGTIGLEFNDANKTLVKTPDADNIQWAYRGNVFAAGSGIGTYGDGLSSYSSGSVTHKATATIYGGTVHRNLYGGGNLATVGPPKIGPIPAPTFDSAAAIINFYGGILGPTENYGGFIFGSSRGMKSNVNPSPYENYASCHYTQVNLGKADSACTVSVPNSVFGGGEYGQVTYNSEVNMYRGATVLHTIYGGGQGTYVPSTYEDEVSGRIKGNTTVNILGGTVGDVSDSTNIFGGCRSSFVHGNTTVNIGSGVVDGVTGFATSVTGSATIYGSVYGANNYAGTVYGDTYVNIYKTAHSATDSAVFEGAAPVSPTFAIANVFGGGHEADYTPTLPTGRAHVHVYTCDNTIEDLYGGGDAAAAYGVVTTIDGGRYNRVFGGGNGEVTAANIGAGGTNTTINAGRIHQLFGGSNKQGSVFGPVQTTLTHEGSCPEDIDEFYSGSNEAPIVGNITTTIACSDTPVQVDRIYGGCNLTNVYGSITLNVEGGTFGYVFGGSKGTNETPANTNAFDAEHLPEGETIGHGGNVTLNLYGGTITNAFGGSDVNGNIEGLVTVNVEDRNTGCPLQVTNVYGGSNLAYYRPTDATITSPVVNINHTVSTAATAILGNVYGGGKGTGSTNGYCVSNPQVNIGDNDALHTAGVAGNVYGGGELAYVDGSTEINITGNTSANITGNVFGGGKGATTDIACGAVKGNTKVTMSIGTVLGSIYGGGELGSVGNFAAVGDNGLTEVRISGGTVGGTDPYVFFTGGVPVALNKNTYSSYPVKNGYYYDDGQSKTVEFKTSTINNILKHTVTGNVFGGCMGSTTLTDGTTVNALWPSLARCKKSRVTVSGTTVIHSSVYGGGELGTVLDSTTVNILGGTIGTKIAPATVALKGELQKYSNPDKFTYFYSLKDDHFKKKEVSAGVWEYEFPEDSVRAILKLDTFFYNHVPSSYQTHADPHYYFGSVFGGGYGSRDRTAETDLTLPSELTNAPVRLAPVDVAGRVYGNTYVNIKGGTIRENVFGGGDLASVGTNVYNGSHEITGTTAGKGICTVTVSGSTTEIGPLDFTGMNGHVFGAGKGIGNDADEDYKQYCNVDSTKVTVSGGHVWGNTFGGGADCHVLGNTGTIIQEGALIGDLGITEYDGYVFGGGRNFMHTNNTAGRVQGNAYVNVTGGRIMCSIIGGGALSSVGTDVDGNICGGALASFADSAYHGNTVIRVSGNTTNTGKTAFSHQDSLDYKDFIGTTGVDALGNIIVYKTTIGTGFGPYLLDCDYSIGDIFGGGKGDTRDTADITAGRVLNTYIKVTGTPRIMADIYAGGEMGCIGWYDIAGANKNKYYAKTGYTHLIVGETDADKPYLGTYYEFSPINFRAGVTWSIVDTTSKRLLHTCSGNIYGGGQGYVENYGDGNGVVTYPKYKNWVSVGRVRETYVTINGVRMMGHVFGGGSRGTVAENTYVTVTGGHIGCEIKDETADDIPTNNRYYYGAVFGGGYGNPKNFYLVNDSSGYNSSTSQYIPMRPAEHAGRVYGNSRVNISGGQIMYGVFGGGDMASTGWVERDANGAFIFNDPEKRHNGVCTVNISGDAVIGPLDYTGQNAYVYGAGRGVSYDVREIYKMYANVNETHLTINLRDPSGTLANYTVEPEDWVPATHGGRIWGSSFGGGADAHVLGDVNTIFQGGVMGTDGTTTYDGNIFGAGRNFGNTNHTNGRVAGNVSVSMTGGRIMGSIFGGGRLALSGIDHNGGIADFTDNSGVFDSNAHGIVTVNVSSGFIGNPDGETLLNGSDESIGDIFGSGKGDTKNYDDVVAGRVMNTHVTVSGNPRIYGCVYGGGEMASVGWWGTDEHHTFVSNTGLTDVNVSGTATIGTELERSPAYLHQHRDDEDDWTVVVDGKVTHTCTGNVVGGSMGDVDLWSPHWISFGRSRESHVTISGSPVILSNVYGGAEQGVVTENTYVKVSGGTIGTLIPAYSITEHDDEADKDVTYDYPQYAFGSVYGGGYGSERWWNHDTVWKYDTTITVHTPPAKNDTVITLLGVDSLYYFWNDSCLYNSNSRFDTTTMTHYTSATMIAGRVYGNTNVTVSGGTIRENVFGGGNMASVGMLGRYKYGTGHDAEVREVLTKESGRNKGLCTVNISGTAVIGVLDGTELNAEVYGGGKGVGNDPDERFKRYCNVNSTSLTVSGGHIYGSTFGGGADCHVLGDTRTTIQYGANIGSGDPFDNGNGGYSQEYDGCVIGGGRNAQNINHSAGRVQGNTYITVTGGRIRRSVIGGGALARTGVDVNGLVDSLVSFAYVYDSSHYGSTFVDVSGDTVICTGVNHNCKNYDGRDTTILGFSHADSVTYGAYLGTTRADDASGKVIVYKTAIGAPDGNIIVDNDYTIGDIFGGGKGDTKDTVDIMAGRVMNTHVKVHGSPRMMGDIYAGAEMASVGWWDTNRYEGAWKVSEPNAKHDFYYGNTGYTKVNIKDSPYDGTPYEFSETNIHYGRSWTLIDSLGKLYHTCSGSVYGGGQGYVEEDATHRENWVHMGRVRETRVTIDGGRFMGNIFGGGSRGVVKENCYVTVTGGSIGCEITDKRNAHGLKRYYVGSVFGGGYGNPKKFRHLNDSSFVTSSGTRIPMIPTEQAGRVYGNTYVNVSGGRIWDGIYGGGDMASTGWVERDSETGKYKYEDPDSRHGGVCTVNITGTTVVGPLDGTGHNAYVYGAGRGVGYDPWDTYVNCANVNETHLTVSLTTTGAANIAPNVWDPATHGGRIWGSLFGGGADAHVLGDVYTTLHSGTIGTNGTTSYDGNIFGAGRNYLNTNHTNGRVAGNIKVLMDGGNLQGSIFGGGRLALSGVDVDGRFIDKDHGNVNIWVSGNAVIGTSNADSLLISDESCGDIFGSGKGDIKNYQDVWAGRVTNTKITVKDTVISDVTYSPRIHGSVFGGGEMASIGYWDDTIHYTRYDTVIIEGVPHIIAYHGQVRNMGTGTNYSHIYPYTGTSEINISGGAIVGTALEYTVSPKKNPGEWTIYESTATDTVLIHTCTGNVFGACQGDVAIDKPRWISMGRSASAVVNISGGYFMGNIFGGSEQGIVTGDTRVNISGGTFGIDAPKFRTDLAITPHAHLAKYYSGDIYAAGYGSDDPDEWDDDSRNDSTTASEIMGLGWGTGLLSGRTFGNSRVDITGGDIYGSVYGGGSFASVGDDKPMSTVEPYASLPVYGVTTVNIGLPGNDPTDKSLATGSATIHGEVFGANNFRGTAYGNTNVNIYRTAHTDDNRCPTVAATTALEDPDDELTEADVEALPETDESFALKAVYGGGNRASHEPIATDGVANVHVYYCEENTIKVVYGGGNAANTKNNHVVVDGGRIYEVFGGGNGAGLGNPGANVMGTATDPALANGVAKTEIKGGLITDVFGGSNSRGNIGSIVLDIEQEGDCDIMVANTYGGGNEAVGGGGVINLYCGSHAGNFYGGSRNADLVGNVVLNIYGGTFENVFGGSKGKPAVLYTDADEAAAAGMSVGDVKEDSHPANIRGNVTVNVFGGNIQKLYGGSDINGNITGKITVNVDLDTNYDCADGLRLDKVYGAGNLAVYFPTDPTLASPEINIINDSCSVTKPVSVPSYEGFKVDTETDRLVKTFGLQTVFGGGYGDGHAHTYYTKRPLDGRDTLRGQVFANPVVNIGGIEQKWDPTQIGGGTESAKEGALVADAWRINRAYIRNNVYGGGEAAPVTGSTMVTLHSSRIKKIEYVAPRYDTTFALANHDTTYVGGSVFGGGYGPTATINGNTTVGIFGDATVVNGNVYGGGEAAVLTGGTDVQVGYERIYVSHLPRFTVTEDEGHSGKYKVEIYSATPGATIVYTTDGTDPTVDGDDNITNGTEYSGIIYNIDPNTTVKAIAVKRGFRESLPTVTTTPNPAP